MSRYTIAIDLGEKSVVAMAGYSDERGLLQIAAVATRQTKGLKAGRIENIAQVNEALSGVIAELESRLGVSIQQAYGGISGEYVRCEKYSDSVKVAEPSSGVSAADVGALHAIMRNVEAPDIDTIMEYTPQNYVVDDKDEERSPVGTFGHTLSSTFNFVLSEKEALKRLDLAFKQSGITLKHCFANALSSAEAVVSSDEMEAGVAVVDIGEGMTNVAIYHHNTLRYLASIPIGGSAINADIGSLLIHRDSVEALKCSCGVAIAELAPQESIDVLGRTARDNRSIPIYNIAVAIQERMTDIIIFVHREIRDSGYSNRLPYGVVLTGGGSKLGSVDELFRRNLDLDVRVASPEVGIADDSLSIVASPEFATAVGILKRGVEMDQKGMGESCIAEETEPELPAEEAAPEVAPEPTPIEVAQSEGTEAADAKSQESEPQSVEPQSIEPQSVEPQEPEPVVKPVEKPVEKVVEKPVVEAPKSTNQNAKTSKSEEPKQSSSNPLSRFMKRFTEKMNDILTSPDDDQEF